MKIGLLPLTLDSSSKTATFSLCSRASINFTFYNIAAHAINIFCFFYFVGFDVILQFWENMMNHSNYIDFLTYMVLVVLNAFSSLQYKSFYDFTKISTHLLLSKRLKWPKFGNLLLSVTIFFIVANVTWSVFSSKATIEVGSKEVIGIMVGNSILFLWSYTVGLVLILSILAWMEHFSQICEEFDHNNILMLSQNCLQIYKTIQDGLSFFFLKCYIAFQVVIVLTIYMFVSTALFGPYDMYTNIIVSICYVIIFLYCSAVLYSVTTTAEATYSSLLKLTNPLRMFSKKCDEDTRMKVKLLIKEIETTPPLNGCGYFQLRRETLTSIVSNTVTYLIILLQFRTA